MDRVVQSGETLPMFPKKSRASAAPPEPSLDVLDLVQQLPERYRIESPLGRGGTSCVFSAYDQWLDRKVAVKWFPAQGSPDEPAIAAAQEAKTLARLNHPAIRSFHDWGQSEGGSYLVLEYIEGYTLEQWLRENGSMSEERVVAILRSVLAALRHAHAQGVVHGDIKPANIIMDVSGTVKLTDFGSARWQREQGAQIWATPVYAAPEVFRGKHLGLTSDLYSLAATALSLLSGKPVSSQEDGKHVSGTDLSSSQLCQFLCGAMHPESERRPSLDAWEQFLTVKWRPVAWFSPESTVRTPVDSGSVGLGRRWLEMLGHWIQRLLTWRQSRVLYGIECAFLIYAFHNVQVAGSLLFPMFLPQIRQVILPLGGLLLAMVNLRLAVALVAWSLLPVLVSHVLGWGIAYLLLLLILTPVIQIAPRGVLHALVYPVLGLHRLGLAVAMLVGRYRGAWAGLVVGVVGQWFMSVLAGLSQSPYMVHVLQYGLLGSSSGLGIGPSFTQGIFPALAFSWTWPSLAVTASAGLAGFLAGSWHFVGGVETLAASTAICALVGLAHGAAGILVPWSELVLAAVMLNVVGAIYRLLDRGE